MTRKLDGAGGGEKRALEHDGGRASQILKCPGFTLVELLVVIAIIAILAAMLLPTLNRAKSAAADSVRCKSNLRQLVLGLNMYVQEYRAYPPVQPHSDFGASSVGLVEGLQPYTRAPWPERNYDYDGPGKFMYRGPRNSIWACPGYNRVQGMFSDRVSGWYATSYGYNDFGSLSGVDTGRGLAGQENMYDTTPWRQFWRPTRENQVVCPSDMIAMGDATLVPDARRNGLPLYGIATLNTAVRMRLYWNAVLLGLPSGDSAATAMKQRHAGRWNIAFCDGHTEALRPTGLFDIRNPLVSQRWNNDHQGHAEECPALPPPP